MDEISVGAVGAAIIAGLVSLLGLIIGKEQKVSEFRQAWIDELRKCLVAYLVNINAACDLLRLKKAGENIDSAALLLNYKLLNEASHGITLRINHSEEPSQVLWRSMNDFECLAKSTSDLTPENIKRLEDKFILAAKELLKFEWKRVKRGEATFVWTKRVIILILLCLLAFFAYGLYSNSRSAAPSTDVAEVIVQKLDVRAPTRT